MNRSTYKYCICGAATIGAITRKAETTKTTTGITIGT